MLQLAAVQRSQRVPYVVSAYREKTMHGLTLDDFLLFLQGF